MNLHVCRERSRGHFPEDDLNGQGHRTGRSEAVREDHFPQEKDLRIRELPPLRRPGHKVPFRGGCQGVSVPLSGGKRCYYTRRGSKLQGRRYQPEIFERYGKQGLDHFFLRTPSRKTGIFLPCWKGFDLEDLSLFIE